MRTKNENLPSLSFGAISNGKCDLQLTRFCARIDIDNQKSLAVFVGSGRSKITDASFGQKLQYSNSIVLYIAEIASFKQSIQL